MSETPCRDGNCSRRLPQQLALWLGLTLALLWVAHAGATVLLLFFFSVVLSIVLSAPVTWLEDRKVPRAVATLVVMGFGLAVGGVLVWLVVPRLTAEISTLAQNVPQYAQDLRERAGLLLGDYPELNQKLPVNAEEAADLLPSVGTAIRELTSFSASILSIIALGLVVFGIVLYTVLRPRPLLRLYVDAFPLRLRVPAQRALARASDMVVGWMRSNIVVGSIEAVLSGVVLWVLGVPGALVWATLAFFAELVPKVGLYLMALPPVLVALATDPSKALWTAVFYLVMNEVMGDVVTPRIRASTMQIHPVSVLFVMLVMAAVFGLVGALIATPIAAFIKAYYEEFVLARRGEDPEADARVEAILRRELPPS